MKIAYDPALPITARHDDIAAAMRDHQVVVVAGETGSGKTTQLPKIAYELGRRTIAHTQPRRIAARSVAKRIADECEVELGAEVGYAVRFDDQTSDDTAIRLVTDGLLLAELQRDRRLSRYDTIIIDEAHERSLSIDFLLGYLKQLLPRRPDLKVVITSATIDVERFAEMFDAPVIEVSGRTYPVEVRYRPLAETGADDQLDAIAAAVSELPARRRHPGVHVRRAGDPRRDRLPAGQEVPPHRDPAAVRAAGRRRPAEDLQRPPRPPHRAGHQRGRDVADRARHPIRHRPRASPASRASASGSRCSGCRSSRSRRPAPPSAPAAADASPTASASGSTPRRTSTVDPSSPIRRSSAPTSPRCCCRWRRSTSATIKDFPFLDPPDSRAVTDGLNLLYELGALSACTRRAADQGRPRDVDAADRPAAGPHAAGRRPARLPGRRARDRLGDVDPGPARTSARAPAGRRREASPVRRARLGLPVVADAVEVHPRAARRAVELGVPPDVPRRVPPLPAHPRVAGRALAAAAHRQGSRDEARQPGRRPRSGAPGAADRAAVAHRAARAGRPRVPRRPAGASS